MNTDKIVLLNELESSTEKVLSEFVDRMKNFSKSTKRKEIYPKKVKNKVKKNTSKQVFIREIQFWKFSVVLTQYVFVSCSAIGF